MIINWHWAGARWWKFDFHSHTPASDDYGKGPNQRSLKQRTPREWLLDYMRAGIDCVAVTDHNSGEWIDKLKSELNNLDAEKPDDYRTLYLFPGVEISVSGGTHLLAIFEPSKTSADITSLLGAAGYRGTHGMINDCTMKSFPEVVEEVSKSGGLAIPAHADGTRGIFQEMQGQTLKQVLDCSDIIAVEMLDTSFQKPPLYVDKKTDWCEILGSDAHHPIGQRSPGSHLTWVKMSKPNLDGLRLALLDGPLSIKRSDAYEDDPNTHGHIAIESLIVENARYIGRAGPFECRLNPWLNAIIGGRGTGKSTLLEFMRLTLRREKEIPDRLKQDFEKYQTAAEYRQDEGLLTQNSKLAAIYRKDDARFRVQWSFDGGVEPILRQEEHEKWVEAQGDIVQRFPVRVYSQKQIFEMARQPQALLGVIDDAPELKYREWKEKWGEEQASFLALRAKVREIEAGLKDESRLRGELEDVKRKLAIFEKTGHAEILKEYQGRLRQDRAVETWEESWAKTGEKIRELAEQITPETLDQLLFDTNNEDDRLLLNNMADVTKRLEQIGTNLNALANEADQVFTEWRRTKSKSVWQDAVNQAKKEYEELRRRLKDEKVGDPSEYGRLVQERQSLEERLKNLSARRESVKDFEKQADESLERLQTLRKKLTGQRSRFLESILKTNPYVSIQVLPYGGIDTVEDEFRKIINRDTGGFEKDIGTIGGEGIIGKLYSGHLQRRVDNSEHFEKMITSFEARLKDLKQRLRALAGGNESAIDFKDKRFVTHMANLPPESLDRLDCWFPEDSLEVRYSTAPGGDFRPVQQGSPGQKTAALLAFLLSYGDEPLILDQPEDDLDNHLIYDLIVNQLRQIKQTRQVIVVTHNANIVVNGDSELVLALDVRAGQTQKVCEGALQESTVRKEICNVMEGGEEAFDQRYRRIRSGG